VVGFRSLGISRNVYEHRRDADRLKPARPVPDYATVPAGADWFIYETFRFNRLLEEADTLIPAGKMKCHYLLGVTQSMKNLIGLAPFKFYELKAGDGYRTGFHGKETETGTRLPRVAIEAMPSNFSSSQDYFRISAV
jgi:hypothetical protein